MPERSDRDRIANVEASRDQPDRLRMYRREASDFERALAGLGDERMWDRLRAALDAPSARARGER